MRILVVTQYFWPEPFRINELVESLLLKGHEVTVLTGVPNYPEGRPYARYLDHPNAYGDYFGAKVVRVPILSRGQGGVRLLLNYLSFVISASIFGTLRLRGKKFDAIFVPQLSPVTLALPALIQRKLKGIPLFLWILDLWPDTLHAIGIVRSKTILRMVDLLVGFIYRRSDQVLIQSEAFRKSLARYPGLQNRVRYFPSWAEPLFEERMDKVKPHPLLAPFKECFCILFAGNMGEAQDFPEILNAAAELAEDERIRWLIVGDGRMSDWVRAEIARRGLDERVFLLGRHPLEKMPAFFKGADALLVSLKREPVFGMTIPGKLQSYLASGVPILGMLDGEGARVIEEAGAGLVCSASRGLDLADRVRSLMRLDPSERKAMGERGRQYCLEHFNRETLVGTLESWLVESQGQPLPAHYSGLVIG